MKTLFINAHQQLRNGWWIALFIGLIVITQPVYRWVKSGLLALEGFDVLEEAISPVLVLLITLVCVRLYKQSMTQAGLACNGRWMLTFGGATLMGAVWLLAVALPIWLMGGVHFSFNNTASLSLLTLGLYSFFLGAALEELLHRGFIFQRLIDGIGFTAAQLLMAMVFALGHLNNPEMEGFTLVRASIDLALASLIFGLAYQRTKSLALPTGLHLGWNWMQGSVMGFNVSGHPIESLLHASLGDQPNWITGGAFGLEGSVFSLVTSMLVLFLLWQWKGTTALESGPNRVRQP